MIQKHRTSSVRPQKIMRLKMAMMFRRSKLMKQTTRIIMLTPTRIGSVIQAGILIRSGIREVFGLIRVYILALADLEYGACRATDFPIGFLTEDITTIIRIYTVSSAIITTIIL